MRLVIASLAFLAMAATAAQASSFVHVAPPDKGSAPSILVLGTPASPDRGVLAAAPQAARAESDISARADGGTASSITFIPVSRSIIAMQGGEPPVTGETVAAVGSPRRRAPEPMVIRGGIIGDAFSPAAGQQPVQAPPEGAEQAAPSPQDDRPLRQADNEGTPGAQRQREPTPPPPPEPPPPALPPGPILRPE